MSDEATARAIVDKFMIDTKDSRYTVIEGTDSDQLVLTITQALEAQARATWGEVTKAYERYLQSLISKAGDWKAPASFAEYCRQRAGEVGHDVDK